MAITAINNIKMLDLPIWEQVTPGLAASAAGTSVADDGKRYIYYLISAAAFYRYDTWANTWQQLANPTGGTVGTGSMIRYTPQIGGQVNGVVYGSIIALISNGVAAPVLNKYDIATNAWSALSITNLPATFGTDAGLVYPTSYDNNNLAIPNNTLVTLGALASAGATTLTVTALPGALPVGTVLKFASGYAVLTAAAAASATSLTVSPLITGLSNGETAFYNNDMFLIGNNATAMYRYSFNTNTWSTTSANAGNPALAVVTAAPGAGCSLKYLSGVDVNSLYCVRGGATSNIYKYNITTNTWSTVVFQPTTETFTTGTMYAVRTNANGQGTSLLIQKDATMRIY